MAPLIGYAVYIDESGDDGIKTVAPLDRSGASEWFVLAAFVVPIAEDLFVQQWLVNALKRMDAPQRQDIHFNRLDDGRKEIVCDYLRTLNFRWFVAVSHKPNMRGYRNVQAEKVLSKNYFYNWMARLLLEKVTKYCLKDSQTRYRGLPQHKIRIEFSTRGGMSYPGTRDYLAKLWLRSQEGRLHVATDDLAWDVVDIGSVYHYDHNKRAGLQLADVVAGAFYRGLTHAGGRQGNLCFIQALAPRVAEGPGGAFGFGVKLMPDYWRCTLQLEQFEIFRLFGAL